MADLVLKTKGLRRVYQEGRQTHEVLPGLDFELRRGEFVVIIGPSGSGKSTLLHLLGLLDRPTSGEMEHFGKPTGALSEAARDRMRNESIGFVFQFDSLLPEFTVLENTIMPARIALARSGASAAGIEDRALDILKKLGLAELTDRLPSGLSGGEKQRVAIARALINRPGVILADEPTGNLDRQNGELVFNTLKELAETLDVAIVAVTHDDTASRFAARTLHLLDGRITDVTEVS